MKVWQTETDYFLGAAAGAGLSSADAPATSELDRAGISGSGANGEGKSASEVMTYIGCALFGGLVGAAGVGLVLQRQNSNRWSQVYQTINSNSGMSTPAYT